MSLERITVYADLYNEAQDNYFRTSSELAFVKGVIKALSGMEADPEFVFGKLKEMTEKFEKGVDISA